MDGVEEQVLQNIACNLFSHDISSLALEGFLGELHLPLWCYHLKPMCKNAVTNLFCL